jgi:sulfopyruvate decarboxylase subunit beta
MKRFDCLKLVAAEAKDALVVSSGDGNFRVRTLGLCSSIALGMALGLPHRKIIALDGDGSLLMNLCSLPTIARMRPSNLVHIVFDNEVYEASGSKKTATACGTDLVGVARASGIKNSGWANNLSEFGRAISAGMIGNELTFVGAKVTTERTKVGPYPMDEVENKYRFIRYIEKTEQVQILKTTLPASYV